MPFRPQNRMGVLALPLLLSLGCGGPAPTPGRTSGGPTIGPHEGLVGALPTGGAFEVVAEPAGDRIRLVSYFYASEAMDAPLAPPPSEVRVDLEMPDGASIPVTLLPGPGPEARFASEPGPFQVDPLIGTLVATIGGQEMSARFSGAHY